jgi:hypothetical protein
MADKFDIKQISPDGALNGTVVRKYKDMGDGTYALVVSSAGGSGGGSGSSLADSSVVDAAGVYWLVRDDSSTLTYKNWATGVTGTPTAPVTPVGKGAGRQVVTVNYNVMVAGTGYSIGDVIERVVVLDVSSTPAVVITATWLNVTTGLIIGSPTMSNLNLIDDNVSVTGTVALDSGTITALLANIGATNDAVAASDTGTFSLIALTKRLLGKLPASVGQKVMAASLPVTLASDQGNLEPGGSAITGASMPTGGVGLTGWLSAIYKSCVGPTPAGTNNIGGVNVDNVADGLTTSGSVSSAATVVSVSTAGFSGGSFQVSGTFVGTVTFEQSNDNATWVVMLVISASSAGATPATTATTADLYDFESGAAYVRARVSAYTSGTVAVSLTQKRVVQPLLVSLQATGISSGSAAIGNVNISTGYVDSTTALVASATYTGTTRATSTARYASFFTASAYADQAGTLFIDFSLDSGATWQAVNSVAVAAASTQTLSTRVVGFASTASYRVRFVNGATAQAVFRIGSAFTAN